MNITDKELAVLEVVVEGTQEDGFSDIMLEDIVAYTGYEVNTVKGLLGSLDKKNLISQMDVNDMYNIYYAVGDANKIVKKN